MFPTAILESKGTNSTPDYANADPVDGIIECIGVEETSKIIHFQPPAANRAANHQIKHQIMPPPALRAARLRRAALGSSRSSRFAAERRPRPAGCGYNGASAPIIIPHYSGAGERLLGRCLRLGPAPCGPAGCGCGGCSARPGRAGRRQVPVTAGAKWRARSRRRGRSRSPRDSSPSGPAAEAAAEAASP